MPTMYADIDNGKFDMTREQLIDLVQQNPCFSDPYSVCVVDTDGVEYTGYNLLDMAGVENETEEE